MGLENFSTIVQGTVKGSQYLNTKINEFIKDDNLQWCITRF
jgi:hypothetical protein